MKIPPVDSYLLMQSFIICPTLRYTGIREHNQREQKRHQGIGILKYSLAPELPSVMPQESFLVRVFAKAFAPTYVFFFFF